MESQFLSPGILEAVRNLLDPKEQETYLKDGDRSTLALAQLYISRLYRQTPAAKPLQSSYDLSQFRLLCCKLFDPSPVAKRSLLYPQALIEASFGARYFTERKDLLSYLMVQTADGEGQLCYAGQTHRLKAGDVFLIDCTKPHRYQTAADHWSYRLIHFYGDSMPDFFHFFEESETYVFSLSGHNSFTPLMQALFMQNRSGNGSSEIAMHTLLTRLVTALIAMLPPRTQPELPEKIREMKDWIHHHFAQEISLDAIAREFSVSKYHLCHEYKRSTGQTIFETVIADRISAAKKLLVYSDLSIQAIAEHTGFADASAMGRTFQKSVGLSPSAFRRQWNRR